MKYILKILSFIILVFFTLKISIVSADWPNQTAYLSVQPIILDGNITEAEWFDSNKISFTWDYGYYRLENFTRVSQYSLPVELRVKHNITHVFFALKIKDLTKNWIEWSTYPYNIPKDQFNTTTFYSNWDFLRLTFTYNITTHAGEDGKSVFMPNYPRDEYVESSGHISDVDQGGSNNIFSAVKWDELYGYSIELVFPIVDCDSSPYDIKMKSGDYYLYRFYYRDAGNYIDYINGEPVGDYYYPNNFNLFLSDSPKRLNVTISVITKTDREPYSHTREPIWNATVTSLSQPPGQETIQRKTDINGNAELNNLIVGKYIFEVSKVGYNKKNTTVEVYSYDSNFNYKEIKFELDPKMESGNIINYFILLVIIISVLCFIYMFKTRRIY